MPRFAALNNRFAAIDIGTNSIKMTAAEVSGSRIDVLSERSEITRLGRSVDAERKISDEAAAKTLGALARYAAEARRLGVANIRACGTSVLRDAANGAEFRDKAADILGVAIEVLEGRQEAELSYLGAVSDPSVAGRGLRLMAFDVGGGSTELIVGTADKVARAQSLDVGAVRITERCLRSDPPTAEQMAEAERAIDDILRPFEAGPVDRLIGIGGTATAIGTILAGANADVQGMEIGDGPLSRTLDRLANSPLELRRSVRGLDPARADVIVAGLLIIRRIMACYARRSFVISTRGLRYGMLKQMSDRSSTRVGV